MAQERLLMTKAPLAVQSLRDHLPVHDRDIDEEEEDDEEVVHESEKAEKRLGEDVERRGQVGEGSNQTEENSDSKHPE